MGSDSTSVTFRNSQFVKVKVETAASEKTLVLEKFTAEGDYAKTEKVADVEYKVGGRYMTVKISKADLGLSGNDYTINFAWTDNVHDEGDYETFSGDILDFYLSGDVAPGGRFKYSFISTAANSGEPETEAPTQPDTEAPTDPAEDPTEAPTDAPATEAPTETEPVKKGCGSSVMGMAVLLSAMAAAVALKKKD